MTKVYVKYNTWCEDSYRSDEQWGEWRTSFGSTIAGVVLNRGSENMSYEEFELGFDVNVGDELFVVHMTYGSGDSFGRSTGELEICWVFKDYDLAVKCVEEYKKLTYIVEFQTEAGVVKNSNPASGYFENIETIEIESFFVKTC